MLPWYKDEKRDHQRIDFLCRVITASMESIHQETTNEDSLESKQAMTWMSRCQNLASTWKINGDELRIHQVCQLYINGFDSLAEEVRTIKLEIIRIFGENPVKCQFGAKQLYPQ